MAGVKLINVFAIQGKILAKFISDHGKKHFDSKRHKSKTKLKNKISSFSDFFRSKKIMCGFSALMERLKNLVVNQR